MSSERIDPPLDSRFLCLYFGDPAECQLCGGWIHCAEVPEGEPAIHGRYCSEECHDEAIELGWCPEEHATDAE